MRLGKTLQRHWPETVLVLAVAIPWGSLLVLGLIWLWQSGHVREWAIAAALLGLLAWPLARLVRKRAQAQARVALGGLAEPPHNWNAIERQAWSDVLAIADTTAPFAFTEAEPLVACARSTIEAVARRFHPEAGNAWARFSLPEILLLTERLSADLRREALQHIPGIRTVRLSHLLWVHQQTERYGEAAQTGWRVGYSVWRLVRAVLNPIQAAGQEASGLFVEKTASVLSYRLRAYATRLMVLEVGRAAIDLYSGRLTLSKDELSAAGARDAADADLAAPAGPVRILLGGQVSAGKSSLLNALGEEIRGAVGPLPTTAQASEYRIELEGRPEVLLVDTPGVGERPTPEFLAQVERTDIVVWVAAATQPARGPDRQAIEAVRAWTKTQLARRPPPLLLALTHVDELNPAREWAPPYDIAAPSRPKAQAIRAAVEAVARTLDVPVDAIVPVAMPPGRPPYNIDALWARIALELDEAKLVQLDRLRVGAQGLRLREVADQLGQAGRFILKGIVGA